MLRSLDSCLIAEKTTGDYCASDCISNMFINMWILIFPLKIGKYTAKLTFLLYDNFGENKTPLERNGMAAILKIMFAKKENVFQSDICYSPSKSSCALFEVVFGFDQFFRLSSF